MFGFGAPVGFHLAERCPERVAGLVVQSGNAYSEGLPQVAPLIAGFLDRVWPEGRWWRRSPRSGARRTGVTNGMFWGADCQKEGAC
ncbi:hypothetical protein [Nonomuraea sp. CA-141351]|uniref:hypothetical protein n=1 Tax=Nonomuraea sp. CA-141351 TaxID=3239996 RepID=UPI003D8A9499